MLSSIDKPRSRGGPPTAPTLPIELLLYVFEFLLTHNDTFTSYDALLNVSLVCGLWRRGAQMVHLKRIEVVREDDATKLAHLLKAIHTDLDASPVETLAIGVEGHSHFFITRPTFGALLECIPRLQKLIIFHTDSLPDTTFYHDPPRLSNLANLVDVTLAAVGSSAHDMPQLGLVRYLPESVRFLQILLPAPPDPGKLIIPHFSLYGLTIDEYPTMMTSLILLQSHDTLQCLTVWKLADISHLARFQKRLRSLKVLGPITQSGLLSDLTALERLELRERNLPRGVLDSIPDTLQYLRFWSTDLARKLEGVLSDESRFRKLRTVVWDYWFSGTEDKKAGRKVIENLSGACLSRKMDLRLCQRINYALPDEGRDEAYEETLRISCFPMSSRADINVRAARERPKFPTRVMANLYTMDVSLNQRLVADKADGVWIRTEMVDECFEDWHHWHQNVLPRARKEKEARLAARQQTKTP